jgi:glycosyltransferase involved in cell wall biosynthesis
VSQKAEETPLISVIVPARDAAATLGRTLDALKRQDVDGAFEVIVVDDGSSDGTFVLATHADPPVRVVRNDLTEGPGAARNRGVAIARAPILAFTDADCFPTPGWLSEGLRAVADADLVQGAVEPDPQTPRAPFDRTIAVRDGDCYYRTANLFVRRRLFESLGGFEDWIVEGKGEGPFGWRAPTSGRRAEPARRNVGEDTWFGWSARRVGARIAFAPNALVHHAVFPQTMAQWVGYQWWKRHVPALAGRIPELREEVFFARLFFERRTFGFDLAVLAVVASALTRRRAALIGALPYARWIFREATAWGGRRGVAAASAAVAADAVSLGALLVGSATWREPVL